MLDFVAKIWDFEIWTILDDLDAGCSGLLTADC
jgi:hypothetical protein